MGNVIKTNDGKVHTVLDRRDMFNLIADEFSYEVRNWLEEEFETGDNSDKIEKLKDEAEDLKDEISSLEADLDKARDEIENLTEKLADIRDILR